MEVHTPPDELRIRIPPYVEEIPYARSRRRRLACFRLFRWFVEFLFERR
jgi:hypothetical protein